MLSNIDFDGFHRLWRVRQEIGPLRLCRIWILHFVLWIHEDLLRSLCAECRPQGKTTAKTLVWIRTLLTPTVLSFEKFIEAMQDSIVEVDIEQRDSKQSCCSRHCNGQGVARSKILRQIVKDYFSLRYEVGLDHRD